MVTRLLEMWEASQAVASACTAAACLYLLFLAAALSVIDIRTHTLPDRLVLPAYPVAGTLLGAGGLLSGHPAHLWRALAGLLALGALYWVLWAVHPAGMGFGDVKLAGVIGAATVTVSWTAVFYALVAAGVLAIAWATARRVSRLAFGPWLSLGAVMSVALVR